MDLWLLCLMVGGGMGGGGGGGAHRSLQKDKIGLNLNYKFPASDA